MALRKILASSSFCSSPTPSKGMVKRLRAEQFC